MQVRLHKIASVLLACVFLFCFCLSAFAAAGAPFAESAYYTQGGYTLHYRQFPAASSPAKGRMLLLHGFISSTVAWEPLAAYYTQAGYACVLVDLPGFGYSSRERKDVQPIYREELLAGLMEALAPGDSWLVAGHSMGGGVAMNLASMYPAKVEALLLFAPAGNMAVTQGSLGMQLLQPLSDGLACIMEGAFRLLLPMFTWEPLGQLVVQAFGYPAGYDVGRFTAPLAQAGTGSSMVYMLQRVKPLEEAAVRALQLPVLLLWAGEDTVLSSSMVAEVEACMPPQANRLTLGGAGHMLIEVNAREVATVSLGFLAMQ